VVVDRTQKSHLTKFIRKTKTFYACIDGHNPHSSKEEEEEEEATMLMPELVGHLYELINHFDPLFPQLLLLAPPELYLQLFHQMGVPLVDDSFNRSFQLPFPSAKSLYIHPLLPQFFPRRYDYDCFPML